MCAPGAGEKVTGASAAATGTIVAASVTNSTGKIILPRIGDGCQNYGEPGQQCIPTIAYYGPSSCQMLCMTGYTFNGGSCIANTCVGSLPANATACVNNTLPSNTTTAYTAVNNCNTAGPCQAQCNGNRQVINGSCEYVCPAKNLTVYDQYDHVSLGTTASFPITIVSANPVSGTCTFGAGTVTSICSLYWGNSPTWQEPIGKNGQPQANASLGTCCPRNRTYYTIKNYRGVITGGYCR